MGRADRPGADTLVAEQPARQSDTGLRSQDRRAAGAWRRRRRLLTATIIGGLAVLVAAGWLGLRYARAQAYRSHLSAVGLPPDLYSAQAHLGALWLGDSVASLDWLSSNLRFLKLRRRPSQPGGMERGPAVIDGELTIPGFENLPRLAGLDISDLRPSAPDRVNEDALTTVSGLPSGLEYLNVNYNDRLVSLEGLPGSLKSLSAVARGIVDFSSLPSALTCLELGSPYFRSPQDQLPRTLRALRRLSLRGTGVQTLRGLPESLISLELFNNPDLRTLDALPPRLANLSVDGISLPSSAPLPPDLEDLHLSRASLGRPAGGQPGFLRNLKILTLNSADVDWRVVPPSLQALSLTGMQLPGPGALPPHLRFLSYDARPAEREKPPRGLPDSLEVLRLSNVDIGNLGSVPPQLRGLAIAGATLHTLTGCPIHLEWLDLRFTRELAQVGGLPAGLESLSLFGSRDVKRIDNLPAHLRFLNLAGTGIARLPVLPPTLEELDISGTAITSLRGLPSGLKVLTVGSAQIRSLAGLPETVRELRFVDAPEDRPASPHFGCEGPISAFERWPLLLPANAMGGFH
jgi:Leucine-rich repeat (LRR) protein